MITKIYIWITLIALIPAFVSAQTIQANQYMIWGIGQDEINIPAGSVITEAVLTVQNVAPQGASLYIHLFDTVEKGLQVGTDGSTGDYFSSYGILLSGVYENGNYVCRFSQNENSQSPIRATFPSSSVTLADSSTVQLSSALLELMDYAGNGRGFGIGIDNGNNTSYSINTLKLELTIRSYTTQTSPQSRVFTYKLTDLMAHWSMDESGGTTALDSSGNNYTAELYGGATFEAGYTGNGLRLDGVDDCAMSMIDVSETSYAVSLRFKTTSKDGGLFSVSAFDFGWGGHDRNLYLSGGNLYARVYAGGPIGTAGLNLADGQWHQVVHTFGDSVKGQRLYVDGVLCASGSRTRSEFTWQDRIYIGFSNDSSKPFFAGVIDDVCIYNQALDEMAIAALSTQAHWLMDESSGTLVLDSSGNNNAAQLYGGATFEAGYMGNGLRLDGVDDCAMSIIDVSETSYAVSLRFKTTSKDGGLFSVSAFDFGLGGHDRHLYLSGGNLYARVYPSGPIGTTGLNLADGQWHQVVHTFGSSINGQRLYVDGVLYASSPKTRSEFTWQDRIYIGFSNDSPQRYFAGVIDDVRIYNQSLDELAISTISYQAFWSMDESSGAASMDSSGNNNTLECIGGVTRETGYTDNGLSLDGIDDCAMSLIDVSETSYAVSLRFKTTSKDGGLFSVSAFDFGWGGHDRNLYLSGGNLYARVYPSGPIGTTGLNFADGQWHQVVHTFGDSINGQRLYVDGVLRASGYRNQSEFTWQDRIYIGFSKDSSKPFFAGVIDDVRIYSQALTNP